MKRLRFTIAQTMAVVLLLGFGFAALRNADAIWASSAYTLAIVMLATALVGAFVRGGAIRTTSLGFAVFGWTYVIVLQLPPWAFGGLGFGPIPKPILLVNLAMGWLQPYLYPAGGGRVLTPYERVSHSLSYSLRSSAGACPWPPNRRKRRTA